MPTWIRVRNDGIIVHQHPTRQNPQGRWHGPWTDHGATSSNDPDAHIRENAAGGLWVGRLWATQEQRDLYARYLSSRAAIPESTRARNTRVRSARIDAAYVVREPSQFARPTTTAATRILSAPTEFEWQVLPRRFGVEIECIGVLSRIIDLATSKGLELRAESYNHATRNYWKIVGDSSLWYSGRRLGYHTMEIVSPPLLGIAGVRQLYALCAALEEARTIVNSSCGLHVHHDSEGLSVNDLRQLAINWHAARYAIDRIVAPSRRMNGARAQQYCAPFQITELEGIEIATTRAQLVWASQRYRTLNLTALNVHNTVEIRQHQGTVEFGKILPWVRLGQLMIEEARRGTIILPHSTVDELFEALEDENLKQYYKRREAELNR